MTIEKKLGSYWLLLIKSYNPDSYGKLLDKRIHAFAEFTAKTLLLAMILFIVTFIPMSIKYISTLPDTFDEVQTFTVDGKVEADHPVELLREPHVVLDLNGEANADFVLTNGGVFYPKYLYFGKTYVPWADLKDMKQQTSARDRLLTGFVLFLVPSIIFWFFLYSVVKLIFIFTLLVLIGYYVPKVVKHRIPFKEVVKIAALAMPSVTLIGVGLYPLAPHMLFWWGLGLTFLLFAIGIALMSERRR
ncbi:MAG: hypothetical protein OXR66_09390 [Candidatus Woesearchaeota archaeon]|nr:hypothetical protein [Candidatus Woesearchaeota archaeon]